MPFLLGRAEAFGLSHLLHELLCRDLNILNIRRNDTRLESASARLRRSTNALPSHQKIHHQIINQYGRRRQMSVQATSYVIEHSKQKGSALLLLIMIANHAHSDGSNAFPSVETLAKECRMSVRQIIRLVSELEASGELVVERSAGRNAHNYAIVMKKNSGNPKKLNSDKLSGLNSDKLSGLNSDKLSGLNSDKLSGLKVANPDKSGNPTLTNRASNPDKSGNPPTPPYKENHHESSIEPSSSERARKTDDDDFFKAKNQNGNGAKSKFKEPVCLEFVERVVSLEREVFNPGGLAHTLYTSGNRDPDIQAWIDNGKQATRAKRKAVIPG
jgi:hypothetical protein